MKATDKNRDPKRAKARAYTDLRCAARKLGPEEAAATLADVFGLETDAGGAARVPVELLRRLGAFAWDDIYTDASECRGSVERLLAALQEAGRLGGAK